MTRYHVHCNCCWTNDGYDDMTVCGFLRERRVAQRRQHREHRIAGYDGGRLYRHAQSGYFDDRRTRDRRGAGKYDLPVPETREGSNLLIRCHDCGGAQVYKKTDEGYIVFHSGKDGKQVKEMLEHSDAAIARLREKVILELAAEFGDRDRTDSACRGEKGSGEGSRETVRH